MLLALALLAFRAYGELTTAVQLNAFGAQNADRHESFVLTGGGGKGFRFRAHHKLSIDRRFALW